METKAYRVVLYAFGRPAYKKCDELDRIITNHILTEARVPKEMVEKATLYIFTRNLIRYWTNLVIRTCTYIKMEQIFTKEIRETKGRIKEARNNLKGGLLCQAFL